MDTATLLSALLLANACLCAALLVGGARNRLNLSLLVAEPWSLLLLARQVQCLAWGALLLHAMQPAMLAAWPGQLLLVAGAALEMGALWHLQGGTAWRPWSLAAAAGLLLSALLEWWRNPDNLVLHDSTLIMTALFFGAAGVRLCWAPAAHAPSGVRRRVGVLLLLLALLVLVPCLGQPWLDGGNHGGRGAAIAMLFAVYLLSLGSGLGFFLLSRDRQQQDLERQSIIDPLTEAPNRRGFFNALAPWMGLARRPGEATAVILLDLDHFKRVNDTYGHAIGDLVLKSVVDIVKKQLRDSDLVGRFGGAELAIMLPRTALGDAEIVAERVRQAIAAIPIKADRAMLSVTASMGLTTIAAHDSVVTLFRRVDRALAAAKQEGRNLVRIAPEESAA